jgi:hypothetical protein
MIYTLDIGDMQSDAYHGYPVYISLNDLPSCVLSAHSFASHPAFLVYLSTCG